MITSSIIQEMKGTPLGDEIQAFQRALDEAAIVAITDQKGTIISCNDKFCEISKYPREEILGKNHRFLKSGFHTPEFYKEMWQAISDGKIWKGEIKNQAKDGSFYWVFTTIIPILSSSGKPVKYLSIRTDVTELKNAKEEAEQERLRALHSEKMASLGEMAAGIAHELGNPLATIRGRAEFLEMMIQKGKADFEMVLGVTQIVKEVSDRMTRIIRGMKTFARDGSRDPFKECSLNELITDTVEFSRQRILEKGIEIRLENFDSPVRIDCRESQISQILVNLLSNAMDAVEALFQEKKISKKWISIECRNFEDHVEIRVTDSGLGISKELQQKILQPFFTTKEVGKGTGLGLSISNQLIREHSGQLSIDLDSKNTCFLVFLPKKQKPELGSQGE